MPEAMRTLFSVSEAVRQAWPNDVIDLPGELTGVISAAFDSWIAIDPRQTSYRWDADTLCVRFGVVILERLRFPLPLMAGAELGLGTSDELLQFSVELSDRGLKIERITFSLVMPPDLLGAVRYDPASDEQEFTVLTAAPADAPEQPPVPRGYELVFETGISTDLRTSFQLQVAERSADAPTGDEADGEVWARLGKTPFLFQIEGPEIISDEPGEAAREARGLPAGFRGLYIAELRVAYVESSSTFQLQGRDVGIGQGGLSGTVGFGLTDEVVEAGEHGFDFGEPEELSQEQLDAEEPPGGVVALELQGFRAYVQRFLVRLDQSIPTAADVAGYLFMPLVDRWFRFRATIGGTEGALLLDFAGAGGEPLIDLDLDWLEIKADRITYLLDEQARHWVSIAGSVRPKIADFDWPELEVEDLRISSDGEVDFKGGWLDFEEARTFDFHAFKVHLEGLGFGVEEERNWLGLNGGITLVEGLPLSAAVRGLRFSWAELGDLSVSLEGIALALEIPGTLKLRGDVFWGEETFLIEGVNTTIELFRGQVGLELIALRMSVDAELMIGQFPTAAGRSLTLFAATIKLRLPVPIFLGATGLGIYGFQGIFGMHVAPNRRYLESGEPESWYEWYKRPVDSDETTARSVVSLKKWGPQPDNYAFGAGLLLGTVYDTGFTINIRALCVVLIPGPVIIIEGTADILKVVGDDTQQEGALYALIVIDGRANTLQINIDIRYVIANVLDIGGGLEAFFDFADSRNWYVNIGVNDPRSKRLHARVLSIIGADTYLMISPDHILFGADIGIDWRGEYGPLQIVIVARFSFSAGMYFDPFLFEGAIQLEGGVTLKIFGIGLGLEFLVMLAAQTPSPWFVMGKATFALTLPWPLPSVSAEAEFRWGEDAPLPIVDPVLENLALMHHRVTDISWQPYAATGPLEYAQLRSMPHGPAAELGVATLPVVPVDVTPVAKFKRMIYGSALPDPGFETMDGYELRYQLLDVELTRILPSGRDPLRNMVSDLTPMLHFDEYDLLPDAKAQTPSLRLWRYEQFEHGDQSWREWRPSEPNPCAVVDSGVTHCVSWKGIPDNTEYPRSFVYRRLAFTSEDLLRQGAFAGSKLGWVACVRGEKLCVFGSVTVRLPEPAFRIEVIVEGEIDSANTCVYMRGRRYRITPEVFAVDEELPPGTPRPPVFRVVFDPPERSGGPVALMDALRLQFYRQASSTSVVQPTGTIRGICWRPHSALENQRPAGGPAADRTPGALDSTCVLEPETYYELRVTVVGERRPVGAEAWARVAQAAAPTPYYFKTGAYPLDTQPDGCDWREHRVNSIAPYLRATTPAARALCAYRDYDLAIELSEPYAEAFFAGRVQLKVRDKHGVDADGESPSVAAIVGLGPSLLRESLVMLALGRTHAGCSAPDTMDPKAPRFYRRPPSLSAARSYTLDVEVASAPGSVISHSVPFVTSMYGSASEHLASGARRAEGAEALTMPLREPGRSVGVPSADWASLGAAADAWATARAAMNDTATAGTAAIALARDEAVAAWDALVQASARCFAELDRHVAPAFAEFPKARNLPGRGVELVRVAVSSASGPAGAILLLQSCEPLDWQRIDAAMLRAPTGASTPVLPVFRPDGARAFLMAPSGAVWSEGRYQLQFHYRCGGPTRPDLMLLTRDGTAQDELVDLTIIL